MENKPFVLKADYEPAGDQPQAIAKLVEGIRDGFKHQTLLGVTGSGKTMSVASVINHVQRPTLVMAHNKTLAAQLYGEFQDYFPENSVEYFVSYYDYYQPEAYVRSVASGDGWRCRSAPRTTAPRVNHRTAPRSCDRWCRRRRTPRAS